MFFKVFITVAIFVLAVAMLSGVTLAKAASIAVLAGGGAAVIIAGLAIWFLVSLFK